jgi:hypothetical protein
MRSVETATTKVELRAFIISSLRRGIADRGAEIAYRSSKPRSLHSHNYSKPKESLNQNLIVSQKTKIKFRGQHLRRVLHLQQSHRRSDD